MLELQSLSVGSRPSFLFGPMLRHESILVLLGLTTTTPKDLTKRCTNQTPSRITLARTPSTPTAHNNTTRCHLLSTEDYQPPVDEIV
jgi:hypothetical protein